MPVDLNDAFARVVAPWTPLIVGELNGQHVKIALLEGSFVWHHHEDADELFLVLEGTLTMRYRDRPDERIGPGQLTIVPRGVAHCPVVDRGAVRVLLMEPVGTVNTGSAGGPRTVVPEVLGRATEG